MKRWLSSLSARLPLAVITASSVNALSFSRSLGRRGVPVLLLDSDGQLAVHTRYAHTVRIKPYGSDPGAWIDTLTEIGRCLEVPGVLIPTADPHAVMVAEHKEAFEPYFRFLALPAESARNVVSKRFQIEYARKVGVPVPETWFPESQADIERLAPGLSFPCILKPDRSHSGAKTLAGRKLLLVNNQGELLDAYEGLARSDVPCMVQEVVPGPDTELVSYLGFWDAGGNETAFITKRKLRQFPALYGNGSIQRTEDIPEIVNLSRRLLDGLEYRGFAGVEFKFDRRDNSYRFVEINPRSSAMNELAIAAGVDFPWIAYRTLIGQLIEPGEGRRFRRGVKCVNEEWDLQAFWALRSKGELNFRQWWDSVRGAHRIIAAADDPKPFLAGLARAVYQPLRRRRVR